MLILALALVFQDPEWASRVHELSRESPLAFAEPMTGAERGTCFEILDRMGAAEVAHDQTLARIEMLDIAIADEQATEREPEVRAMRDQALVIANRYRSDLAEIDAEAARTRHALMSVALTFCRIQP